MQIRDPIHGSIRVSKKETQVLDSSAVQRLRMIKQLGFTELSFPGGTHSRYTHSLGAFYLAGLAFDSIFRNFSFSTGTKRESYRQVLCLSALLHDVGHGPLSHSTEEVMPFLSDLKINVYKKRKNRKANHEDYSIKFITGSRLTEILSKTFSHFSPLHVACLINGSLEDKDHFFVDQGLNFRPLLSQLISSEVDVDRMDYLVRDAYFCGASYGKVDLDWLLENFRFHIFEDKVYLALDRKALYTFDDFLLSRHHMHLMVYFHHKSVSYEQMLYRYLISEDCDYSLPEAIEDYVFCTDFSLYKTISLSKNPWAKRITQLNPFKVVYENHLNSPEVSVTQTVDNKLRESGIDTITVKSQSQVSKIQKTSGFQTTSFYILDEYGQPSSIEKCTEIFQKYEKARAIERIYVEPEKIEMAKKIIKQIKSDSF